MLRRGKIRKQFEAELSRLVSDPACDKILDIGTSQRFAKELRSVEGLFEGKAYRAAGYNPTSSYGRYNCDEHQDIQSITHSDGSFDLVICIDVLEHVDDPFKAVSEIKRVLRPGGGLFLTVPFLTGFHGRLNGKSGASASHEEYSDYWRFTHQGLHRLFSDFKDLRVLPLDGPLEARLNFFRLDKVMASPFVRTIIDWIDKPVLGRATSRHLVVGKK